MKTFFLTGTGTGIGKTFTTGVIAKLASEDGLRVAVMKPIQTGLERPEDGDIGQVARMAPKALKLKSELACPYCLHFESSPHLAAEKENRIIDFAKIADAYEQIVKQYSPDLVLLEGAGGLIVPIDNRRMMIDLMAYFGFPVILAADAGLGTINHTILSLNELRRRNLIVEGIYINRMPIPMPEIEQNNVKMIRNLSGGIPVLGVIENSPESAPAYHDMIRFWNESASRE